MNAVPPARGDAARLFLALWPPAGVLEALRAWRDAWTWPPAVALARAQGLHLTLHFIGAVERSRLPELMPLLAVPCRGFELTLDRAGVWPRGIAVLEPSVVPAPLTELHGGLREALQRETLPTEARAFRPHLTLARRAQGALPPQHPPLRWRVRGYALIESRGGVYRVLQRYA